MMNEKAAILEAINLSLAYGSHQAFEDISLPIFSQKITAIVGPSGCGKTSFLMCLNRLIELVPAVQITGDIRFSGQSIFHRNTHLPLLRKNIGMIFQKPNPFPFSIRKNIEFPLKEHGVRSPEHREEIMQKVLEDVGLWPEVKDRLNKSALNLSGGQQQRLCIARALALQPQILLMDEPCSALDPISSGTVEELIKKLRQDYTIVVVTHNLAQAKRLSQFMAMFWVSRGIGRLIEFGPTEQLMNCPKEEITAAYVTGLRG